MDGKLNLAGNIPSWQLYGEKHAFPDILHCEKITDRAAGLDWTISPHLHPHLHQFFLVRSGQISMTADGTQLSPDAPCVISIPTGVVHGFSFSAGTDGFVVTIPLQSLPDIFAPQANSPKGLSKFAVLPADAGMVQRFVELHDEHGSQRAARVDMLKALATTLSYQIQRAVQEPNEIGLIGPDAYFQHFQDLVQLHFKDRWSLSGYADELGLSARHLGRLCRRIIGQSPSEYIEAVIMREACRLLVYTRDSVAAIGYQLGYEDPSYFSRSFRRYMGKTPREYPGFLRIRMKLGQQDTARTIETCSCVGGLMRLDLAMLHFVQPNY